MTSCNYYHYEEDDRLRNRMKNMDQNDVLWRYDDRDGSSFDNAPLIDYHHEEDEDLQMMGCGHPRTHRSPLSPHHQQHQISQKDDKIKRVRFSPCLHVREIEHINDFSVKDMVDRWYVKEDIQRIKKDNLFHIKLGSHYNFCSSTNDANNLNNKWFLNHGNDQITFRGLRSKMEHEQRRQNQQEAIHAVLNEQLLQRVEGGTHNLLPELTAMLYNVLSFPCQQTAFQAGVCDALAVYGTVEEYQRRTECQNPLFETMPMESCSDFFLVEDSIVKHVHQESRSNRRSNGNTTDKDDYEMVPSVEDWLFERFQRGEQLANFHQQRESISCTTMSIQ
eukprot:CAMPEP_0178810118 /NCGR_PEP_ID=MMETSP0745-20121128/18494_1 /TAXON_ID=913974 /ORGANISM="Nitzschia punctata, Strain CCMP561" /LENGTH=333 /DNA_ID=CAMNT_0020470567 /DNA_START=116 /DNA_END=1117 /DNA_ORIENTATION=-